MYVLCDCNCEGDIHELDYYADAGSMQPGLEAGNRCVGAGGSSRDRIAPSSENNKYVRLVGGCRMQQTSFFNPKP